MNREDAIAVIEETWPADSGYREVEAIGKQFFEAARAMNWRNESDAVLIEYAKLCETKERISNESGYSDFVERRR